MSPHGIVAPPNQSSRNSGSKCQLARPLTLPIFVALSQKVCEISAVEYLCFRKSGPSSANSVKICYAPMPLIVPNFIALGQTVYEIKRSNFVALQYIGAPRGPSASKFTSLGAIIYSKARTTKVPKFVPF